MAEHPSKQIIEQLATGLQEVKRGVSSIMEGHPTLAPTRIRVENDLQRIISYLQALNGEPIAGITAHPAAQQAEEMFKQPASIFGQRIVRQGPVKAADLEPTTGQLNEYQRQRNELYDGIESKSLDDLQQLASIGEGERLIRGVAKVAQYGDYQGDEITLQWLQGLVAAVRVQKEKVQADQFAKAAGVSGVQLQEMGAAGDAGGTDAEDDNQEGAPDYTDLPGLGVQKDLNPAGLQDPPVQDPPPPTENKTTTGKGGTSKGSTGKK